MKTRLAGGSGLFQRENRVFDEVVNLSEQVRITSRNQQADKEDAGRSPEGKFFQHRMASAGPVVCRRQRDQPAHSRLDAFRLFITEQKDTGRHSWSRTVWD